MKHHGRCALGFFVRVINHMLTDHHISDRNLNLLPLIHKAASTDLAVFILILKYSPAAFRLVNISKCVTY
jgi:hypothetical protein